MLQGLWLKLDKDEQREMENDWRIDGHTGQWESTSENTKSTSVVSSGSLIEKGFKMNPELAHFLSERYGGCVGWFRLCSHRWLNKFTWMKRSMDNPETQMSHDGSGDNLQQKQNEGFATATHRSFKRAVQKIRERHISVSCTESIAGGERYVNLNPYQIYE